eukprot:GHVP01060180.1.p1 GENE.GHVP01060180.1~~GHVP01060180.1.p1  ORF type:complete len:222 (+),score=38.39 GHVP01060180.1:54-668(+)
MTLTKWIPSFLVLMLDDETEKSPLETALRHVNSLKTVQKRWQNFSADLAQLATANRNALILIGSFTLNSLLLTSNSLFLTLNSFLLTLNSLFFTLNLLFFTLNSLFLTLNSLLFTLNLFFFFDIKFITFDIKFIIFDIKFSGSLTSLLEECLLRMESENEVVEISRPSSQETNNSKESEQSKIKEIETQVKLLSWKVLQLEAKC